MAAKRPFMSLLLTLLVLPLSGKAQNSLSDPTGESDAVARQTNVASPFLQVSALECSVQLQPFRQSCETTWEPFDELVTGKDHTYEKIVLASPPTGDWKIEAHYQSIDSSEDMDLRFTIDSRSNMSQLSRDLLNASDAFVAGFELEAEDIERALQDLTGKGYFLIAYFPRVGVKASYTLIIGETRSPVGTIRVNYPGA